VLAEGRSEERFHKEGSAEMLPNTGAKRRFGIRAVLRRGDEEGKLWKVYKYSLRTLMDSAATTFTPTVLPLPNLEILNFYQPITMTSFDGKCHCGQTEWTAKLEKEQQGHILWCVNWTTPIKGDPLD
jgi:hypothetical protein